METLQIILANGDLAKADRLRSFFDKIFQAEDSGEEFPVELETVWRIGYAAKAGAVKALRKNFVEGIDYKVSIQLDENPEAGRPAELYKLSVSCMEYLAVRANRAVFEVYRQCRQAIRNILRPALPGTYKEALTALLAEVSHREALEAQAAIDAPKAAFTDAVAAAAGCISIGSVAKYLKIPGVGRTKLFRMLRADKILQSDNEPYASQIDAGHFEVQLQAFDAGSKGKRTAGTTRCTPKGLIYLAKKYKQAA